MKLSIVGSLCDREVACSASDLQGLNFESCVWRAVLSHSSRHLQEVLLAQFSLYVHKSAFGYLLKGDKSVLMKRLGSDSKTVPKPNVLLVEHMYGERQEQWQTLRTVARHAAIYQLTLLDFYLAMP